MTTPLLWEKELSFTLVLTFFLSHGVRGRRVSEQWLLEPSGFRGAAAAPTALPSTLPFLPVDPDPICLCGLEIALELHYSFLWRPWEYGPKLVQVGEAASPQNTKEPCFGGGGIFQSDCCLFSQWYMNLLHSCIPPSQSLSEVHSSRYRVLLPLGPPLSRGPSLLTSQPWLIGTSISLSRPRNIPLCFFCRHKLDCIIYIVSLFYLCI